MARLTKFSHKIIQGVNIISKQKKLLLIRQKNFKMKNTQNMERK